MDLPVDACAPHYAQRGRVSTDLAAGTTLLAAGRLVAGTAGEATPGDRAERFHGDRRQPAAGQA